LEVLSYIEIKEMATNKSTEKVLNYLKEQEELKKGLKDLELCSEKVPIILFLEREEL